LSLKYLSFWGILPTAGLERGGNRGDFLAQWMYFDFFNPLLVLLTLSKREDQKENQVRFGPARGKICK